MYHERPSGRPTTRVQHGLVTSPHYIASSTGLDILRDGGSAVDAAIAVNASLCVVYPHMAGLGGDGFWLLADADTPVEGINASGPAAKAASESYYSELGYSEIPERGSGSALTVPGAVDGWRLAHEKYGKLPWKRLFKDSITHAREGVPISDNLSRWISLDANVLAEDSSAAETYLTEGSAPEAGSILRQCELADSLATIAQLGPREGFYDGPLAEAFCEGLSEESPLTATDFREYHAEWVEPISIGYRGYTAHSFPPNTQGIAALQILGILNGFDVESWGDGTADYYHNMAETVKVAFADRDAWITDPEAIDFPAEKLLSPSYLDKRRSLIESSSSLSSTVEPGLVPSNMSTQPQDPDGDTCYFSIVDDDGLAVSAIQSIYFDFGSGTIAGDTGIIPQNRGSFFSLDGDHINNLEPGKRTFHTLIPSLLTKNGAPRLVYGTMGGEGQPQTQAALVSRIVDFGYDVQSAIEAPRWLFGRTWGEKSKSLSLEGRVPDGVVTELQKRGQSISMTRDFDDTMGHAAAIRLYDDGTLEGGADPRGDGAAIGY